ncbi:hypothetical protein CPB85DRAFT_1257536 [Mucidula mucida]|nr:hypothetical protein CPB85DRAFT_1257536 [Mucidula mucida]
MPKCDETKLLDDSMHYKGVPKRRKPKSSRRAQLAAAKRMRKDTIPRMSGTGKSPIINNATWVNEGDGWKERVRAMKSVIGLLSQLTIFPPPIAHTHSVLRCLLKIAWFQILADGSSSSMRHRFRVVLLTLLLTLSVILFFCASCLRSQPTTSYHSFSEVHPSHVVADYTISDECLEQWLAGGRWEGSCTDVKEARVDLVYVWVNGTDPLHVKARSRFTGVEQASARFRDHDELRYSLRAAAKATEGWAESTWHIITADFEDGVRRVGQMPQWLDFNASAPGIWLHHPTLSNPSYLTWIRTSFLTISPTSAFHSPLYGPVFRLEMDNQVTGDDSRKADGNGEWRSLGWNQRFGTRTRAYVSHNARALSLPLMHEASLAFGKEFAATPLSTFRGSGGFEVNTVFLCTHWVIERKREALLWSWIVGKWGGVLDKERKEGMWRELGGSLGFRKTRTSVDEVNAQFTLAGIRSPRVRDRNVEMFTEYIFVSQEGNPTEMNGFRLPKTLPRERCFGKADEDILAWDLFIGVMKYKPDCGDAIIAALIHQERVGSQGLGQGGGMHTVYRPKVCSLYTVNNRISNGDSGDSESSVK